MATPIRRVLDISHHNTVNDLDAVAAAGIWGIIHKATEGTSYVDDKYAGRKKGFLEIGLLWGAYHFAHPGSVQSQVDHFLKTSGVDDATLYALDWEASSSGTMDEDDAEEFCHLVEEKTGRKCVIYSGNAAKEEIASTNGYLGAHRLWLAQYGSSPAPQESWSDWWLWQYSDGEVGPGPHGCPGVSGFVDTNSYEDDEAQLRAEWSGTDVSVPVPPPVAAGEREKIIPIRIYQPPGVKVVVTIEEG
jgi:lysozyme